MKRRHFFEWEDQAWFPHAWRNYMTDMLQHGFTWGAPRAEFVTRHLGWLLDATGSSELTDLCSGSTGPVLWFRAQLEQERGAPVSVLLTDKYPNLEAWRHFAAGQDGRVRMRSEPLDVTALPEDVGRACTMFTCFHHFAPETARGILAKAKQQGRGIAVFEVSERSLKAMLIVLLGGPLAVLLLTPWVRPFRWGRLLWTYLLPVVPLALMWDGVVSCLRSYTVAELREMTAALGDGYEWQVSRERLDGLPATVTCVVGLPMSMEPQMNTDKHG